MRKKFKNKVISSLLMMTMALGLCSVPVQAATDIEAAEKTATWQPKGTYEVKIEVPGADGDNLHDEIIIMVDGSYSMDEEWEDMKKAIMAIGETVLNGSGNTQLTLMSFGISPNVVLEHVSSVSELEESLPELPGGLLYGRSATNCDGAFEGIEAYIEGHDETLSDVNVIFLSDGGANLDSTPKDWIAYAGNLPKASAQEVQIEEWGQVGLGNAKISDESRAIYGEDLDELIEAWKPGYEKKKLYEKLSSQLKNLDNKLNKMDKSSEEYAILQTERAKLSEEYNKELALYNEYAAATLEVVNAVDESGKTAAQRWVKLVFEGFYENAGLTKGEEYPVYTVEYAYVDYQKENDFYLYDTFYYVLGSSGNDKKLNQTLAYEEAKYVAEMEEIEKMWLVRWGNDSRSGWMTNVENTEFIQSESISTLTTALEGVMTDLARTPFNNVVVTDYMSKWVNLDADSIKVVDNTTEKIIWTIADGWTITEGIPTQAEPPVVVEKVEAGDYEAGGADVIGNTNGDIYKITWSVKDGALLRADSYSLVYNVTIDTEEEGFQYNESYPANGNTYMDYTDENGEEQVEDIDVPDVTDLERSLHIYKYTPVGANDPAGDGTQVTIDETAHTALANVEFSIYKVCTLADLESTNGEVPDIVLGEEPTEADLAEYCTEENYVTTVTTDALGHAMHIFGDASADGVYLVVEEENPAIAVNAKPFFVSLPMTNPDGDGWLYTVYVYPKNDLEPAPVVDKDVTEVGNDYGTFDMDENITYIIRGEIPAGLATAEVYALSDTLDTRLDYEGNVIVKLYTEAETEIVLDDIVHYTLTETEATTDKGASLKVELTKSGMEYVMENLGTDVENVEPEIRVYFNASLNSSADLGILIPNNATIDYTNSTGYKYMPGEVPEEERPEVETGGINILKKDATDTNIVLSGAEFKLARDVKEGENTEERLVVDGTVKKVVYVDFYDATGEKVFDVTTDEKGEAVISGLAYGEYYLVEVKAPAGYNLLTKPVKVTINKQSHTEGAEYVVLNSNQFRLPETGGVGTTIFTVSGMAMLAAAVVLLLKKKDSEEA